MRRSLSTPLSRGRPICGDFPRLPPSGLHIPRAAGRTDVKVIKRAVVLARKELIADPGAQTSRFIAVTPSSRLRLSLSVAFEVREALFDQFGVSHTGAPTGGTWTLNAQRDTTEGGTGPSGGGITLNTIFTNRALPDGWEMETAGRRLEATCSLTFGIGASPCAAGSWIAVAEWEPNSPIELPELEKLFTGCQIALGGQEIAA